MKRANEILALGRICPGLAADRTVDHRQQGRGNLYVWNAPQVCGGDEASHVTDYSASHRHNGTVPTDIGREHLVGKRRPGLACLI